MYKQIIKNIPNNTLLVSLNLNTDGAPITNSRNYSIWPVLATILELDPMIIIHLLCFKNVLIFGIWFGTSKPNYNLLISKSIENFKTVNYKSLVIKGYEIKLNIHSFIADLPAKAAILNVKQFNGRYGFLHCLHPGSYSSEYSKTIYLPDESQDKLVTNAMYEKFVQFSVENNQCVFGVKGFTPLSSLIKIPGTYKMVIKSIFKFIKIKSILHW